MKAQLLAAGLILGTSSVAIAADPGAPMDVAPVDVAPLGFTWTGGYVGAQLGYLWGETDQTEISTGDVIFSPDPDGVLAGLYLGYSHQFANDVVLGIEADWAWSNADGRDTAFTEFTDTELNWSGAIRARLGYAVDRFLPFVSAGVAFADYDHKLNGTSFGDTYTGWTVGAGVEYAFTDVVIGRLEYRYTDFGSQDFFPSNLLIDHEIDLTTSDIRLGIAYKF